MTELEQYIKSHFEILQSNELNEVSSLFKQITLKKGEYFLTEGMQCNKFCFIKSGYLRIFTISDDNGLQQKDIWGQTFQVFSLTFPHGGQFKH